MKVLKDAILSIEQDNVIAGILPAQILYPIQVQIGYTIEQENTIIVVLIIQKH